MRFQEVIGRRAKLKAWYDHEQLIAAHRRPKTLRDCPEGTITHVNECNGRVSVLVEELSRVFTFPWDDVEVLP